MRRIAYFGVSILLISGACVHVDPIHRSPRRTVVYHRPSQTPLPRQPRRAATHRHLPRRQAKSSFMTTWMPNYGRISPRWKTIVIHHSATRAGGARTFDRFHRKKGWDELGYHFVIGNGTDTPDGFVEVGPRWHKQKHGAHCKTPNNYYNEHGIGICLVGDFTTSPPTPRQLASLERMLRFLTTYCRIPPQRITTHGAVTGKTQCPGGQFHLSAVRRALLNPVTAASLP